MVVKSKGILPKMALTRVKDWLYIAQKYEQKAQKSELFLRQLNTGKSRVFESENLTYVFK